MFFNGSLFWFLNGIIFVLACVGFKIIAKERGWTLTWWKWLLTVIWYAIFTLSFYTWGTLIGENEGGAGFKVFLLGMFVSLVLGVGLVRLFTLKPKSA